MSDIDQRLKAEYDKAAAARKARLAAGKLGYTPYDQDPDAFLESALRKAAAEHKSIKLPGKVSFPEDYNAMRTNPAGGFAYQRLMTPALLQQIQQTLYPKPLPPAPNAPSASAGPAAAAAQVSPLAPPVDPFKAVLDMAKDAAQKVNPAVKTGGNVKMPKTSTNIKEVDLLPTMASGQKTMKPMSAEGKALLMDLMNTGKVYGSEMLPSQHPQGRRYNPGGQEDADAEVI